jgi:acetate kinase
MKSLVLNSGSSSLKYQLFDVQHEPRAVIKGVIERIGSDNASHQCSTSHGYTVPEDLLGVQPVRDHRQAIDLICRTLLDGEHSGLSDLSELLGIGHRVVHGGERFHESALIDETVLDGIEDCARLAPLHNPPALFGIRACTEVFGEVPQVAVFDTAFHHTLPKHSYLYGIPLEYYRKYGIRKYGFHGTSHMYVSQEAARLLGKRVELFKVITCHLGNGCSITAVNGGRSIETTMGLTPLGGVIMGTRCGDIDPYLPIFMHQNLGMSVEEIERTLNKESGLKGICGRTDMRDIIQGIEDGDHLCELALDIYTYRIARFIGSFSMVLGGPDAIVFTAGVGENSPLVRARILSHSEYLGVDIDPDRNAANALDISARTAKVRVLVIPTNEELVIARETTRLLQRSKAFV